MRYGIDGVLAGWRRIGHAESNFFVRSFAILYFDRSPLIFKLFLLGWIWESRRRLVRSGWIRCRRIECEDEYQRVQINLDRTFFPGSNNATLHRQRYVLKDCLVCVHAPYHGTCDLSFMQFRY